MADIQQASASNWGSLFGQGSRRNNLEQQAFDEKQREFDTRVNLWNQWMGSQKDKTSGISSLVNAYNQTFSAAQEANLQRNNQMLGMADTQSGQQRADVISNFQKLGANQMQGLARLGLSNTTMAPSLQTGIQREQQAELNRVGDQSLATRLGIMGNFKYGTPDPSITTATIQAFNQQPSFQF